MDYCYHCMAEIKHPESRFCPECGNEHNVHYSQSNELPAGTYLCDGRYLVGKSLGEGGFGITYIGFDTKINKKIVIKETFYSGIFKRNSHNITLSDPLKVEYDSSISLDEIMNKTQKECFSLSKAENFNNIVKVYDWFAENNTAYIITEYINGDTLYDRVTKSGAYSWDGLYTKFKPLMQSLAQLHKMGLLHRDIKPQNIMLREVFKGREDFVLIDFGLARSNQSQTKATMAAFSPGFAPFEQRTPSRKDDTYTDVYSLAATMYFSLTEQSPDESIVGDVHENFPYLKSMKAANKIPGNVYNAFVHALQPDYRNRCHTIDEFIEELDDSNNRFETPIESPYNHSRNNDFYNKDIDNRTQRAVDMDIGRVPLSDPVYSSNRNYNSYQQPYSQRVQSRPTDNYNTDTGVQRMQIENGRKSHALAKFLVFFCVIGIIAAAALVLDAANITKYPDFINPIEQEQNGNGEYAVVPNLIETDRENALAQLESIGFDYEITMQPTESYDENSVVSQYPTPGMYWEIGEIVDIYVASPIPSSAATDSVVKVPDVLNKNYYDAADELVNLGFEVSWETAYEENAKSNKIERIEPRAGSSLRYGSKIVLYVSQKINSEDYVEIDDYVGMNIDEVKSRLEEKGLNVTYSVDTESSEADGTIIKQTQQPNKLYKKGRTINFVVAKNNSQTDESISSSVSTGAATVSAESSEASVSSKNDESSKSENSKTESHVQTQSIAAPESSKPESHAQTQSTAAPESSKPESYAQTQSIAAPESSQTESSVPSQSSTGGESLVGTYKAPVFHGIRASSRLDPVGSYTYVENNTTNVNGKCWSEGKPGSGIGEYVEYYDSKIQTVSQCTIYNGYDENEQSFKNNGRLTKVTFEFSDGSQLTYDIDPDTMSGQTFYFGKAIDTYSIKVIIADAKDGDKYQDTCISCIIPK